MVPDLVGGIVRLKESRIKNYPVHCLTASQIGFECDRFHYFQLTRWQDKSLHDVGLEMIFEDGNLHEQSVLRDLQDAGFTVIEQQASLNYNDPKITGRVDAVVVYEGQGVPVEIKSINPYDFDSISNVYHIRDHKKHTIRKYYAQIQLYLLNKSKDTGLFLFKCKQPTKYKQIEVSLDYEFAETLLKKAERIYKAVAAKSEPDRVTDREICRLCNYKHVCLPDIDFGAGISVIDDGEVESMLERRAQLSAAATEYDEIDKSVKIWARERGSSEILCGKFHIEVKEQPRRTKASEEKVSVSKVVKIEKVGE